MQPIRSRWTLGLLSLSMAVFLSGCEITGPSGDSGANAGGSRSGTSSEPAPAPPPPPSFQGGGVRVPPIRPRPVNQPGPAPAQPPTSSLPEPATSTDLVSELESRFRFDISGPGATPANLALLDRSLQDFKPNQLTGLKEVYFPLVQGFQGLQGLWQSNGRQAKISLYAQTGRSPQVMTHTISHELGHHMSLFARKRWGDQYDAALGKSGTSYPSEYSRTQDAEKVAENIAFSLLGNESEQRPLRSWSPSPQAKNLLQEEFGARVQVR